MNHEHYMNRCFELAKLGLGSVSPNPMVGCVIVHDNKIIGEGYHQKFGLAHAEVNAIQSVTDKSLLTESTLYVNLEPCVHFGKTPPCSDLVIKSQLKRVVVCNFDPYKEVAGRGLKQLRDAGIEVIEGVLENEGNHLNRRFFIYHNQKRTYIILKWAQTIDGFIDRFRHAGDGQDSLKITGNESNKLVHKWRTEEAAILVGKNTVMLDDPSLTARFWPGKNPLRLVVDPRLELPKNLRLLSDGNPTWVYNAMKAYCEGEVCYERIDDPANFPQEISSHLFHNDIQSLIIEGGSDTIQRFYEAGLWDEVRIFTGMERIGTGVRAPEFNGRLVSTEHTGADILQVYSRL
jgi:diaminohydroxyphosphoribosylaminopyrimidine deaminase / 5-amino-6-(5-phosphoribosylamino)uracil reductase